MPDKTEAILQDQLLKRLTDYGDSILESSSKSKKRKGKKKPSGAGDVDADKTEKESTGIHQQAESGVTSHTSKRQKKKQKKKMKQGMKTSTDECDSEEVAQTEDSTVTRNLKGSKKHVDRIVGELGLKQFKCEKEKQQHSQVLQHAENQAGSKKEPEVIVFSSRRYDKPKKQAGSARQVEEDTAGGDSGKFDIKEARFEVRKFGLAGFQGEEKEKAMTDLMLRLGAKPKKTAFVNYKELQEERKQQLHLEENKRLQEKELGMDLGKKKSRKRARDKTGLGSVDGQVGKFNRGVQFIKPNDVQGIKKSKLKNKS